MKTHSKAPIVVGFYSYQLLVGVRLKQISEEVQLATNIDLIDILSRSIREFCGATSSSKIEDILIRSLSSILYNELSKYFTYITSNNFTKESAASLEELYTSLTIQCIHSSHAVTGHSELLVLMDTVNLERKAYELYSVYTHSTLHTKH